MENTRAQELETGGSISSDKKSHKKKEKRQKLEAPPPLPLPLPQAASKLPKGTQFTCFTGTKVQILTHRGIAERLEDTREVGERRTSSVYLLYWYKSTTTDAGVADRLEDTSEVADVC